MVKAIRRSQAIEDALAAIARAEAIYVPGRDSSSVIEIPKLALAHAVLAAVAAQERRSSDRKARVDALPKARPAAAQVHSSRSKERRRA